MYVRPNRAAVIWNEACQSHSQMRYQNKKYEPVIANEISPTKPQLKRAVKDSAVSQRFLAYSASLFLNTIPTRLSR
jgi:hypothetical protein